jgi:hydrogenase-4 component B
MFLLLSGGDWTASFTTLQAHAAGMDPLLRSIVFLAAFIGFGSKAGIVPLHVWLPMAHPVAPSHISALMSGVLIKMGIYGILRIGLDLLGGGPAWWGGIVLALGIVSAVVGVLYALMEQDLKRLLAYSSVENIGIILIGLGAGFVFQSYGLMNLALLGFMGGLYHTINHAAFKGLLFLGAGSVLRATHTRNMEEMGGLIKRMPWTAFFFLVGAAAISALPPLNGFASEWMVFQALLDGFKIPEPEMAILMPLAIGMLALASGLAAACFVKAFGITFLALPRSEAAEKAKEAPKTMLIGMGCLSVLCAGLGVLPFAVAPQISRIIAGLGGLPTTPESFAINLSLRIPNSTAQISPTLIAVGLLVILGLLPLLLRILKVNRNTRVTATWGCGRIGQTPRQEYTATAFAEPLKRVFAQFTRPTKELTIDFHPESKYFVQSIEYHSEITPWFEKYLYNPLIGALQFSARHVRQLQSGSLHLYLLYICVIMVVLLAVARWAA